LKIPAQRRPPIEPGFPAPAMTVTRHQIAHRGLPVGHAEFVASGLVIADLEPGSGYASVRYVIREASEVLWAMGFFGYRGANPGRMPEEVLARAASLDFEVRDANGDQVHADWVNIIERPGPAPTPILVARFRLDHAGVPSVPSPAERSDHYSDPDA
jgi:hypothetical protein